MDKETLTQYADYLEAEYQQKTLESKTMFDGFSKAQDIWARLKSGHGGIKEVVKTLGLNNEFKEYQAAFRRACEAGNSETASIMVGDFADYCAKQVEENFYLFK